MSEKENLYLREIGKIPLLSVEEERELTKAAACGDKKARDRLIKSNLRFVVKIAMHFKGCGLDIEDLISEGNAGLIKAVEKFNPEQNVRFATYAVWWIKESIRKAIYQTGNLIRLPKDKALNSEKNKWVVYSLDTPLDEEKGATLCDLQMDKSNKNPEESYLYEEVQESVYSAYNNLSESEQKVIGLRFGLHADKGLSLTKTGELMNYSKEGVRQIEKRALEKMSVQLRKAV